MQRDHGKNGEHDIIIQELRPDQENRQNTIDKRRDNG